ncbi:MAG: hypothetical protein AAF481_18745 [Acidobacteriota bacterium]
MRRSVLILRSLLAVGFMAPGWTKVVGLEFAPGMSEEFAAGRFFAAFHATGAYYTFVGLAQFIAGALLLFRGTALLGALLYLPIIANICVLTWAVDFGTGTPWITVLMLAGCTALVLWDAPRWAPIFGGTATWCHHAPDDLPASTVTLPTLAAFGYRGLRFLYWLGLIAALTTTFILRGLAPRVLLLPALVTVLGVALVTLVSWGWGAFRWWKRRPGGRL